MAMKIRLYLVYSWASIVLLPISNDILVGGWAAQLKPMLVPLDHLPSFHLVHICKTPSYIASQKRQLSISLSHPIFSLRWMFFLVWLSTKDWSQRKLSKHVPFGGIVFSANYQSQREVKTICVFFPTIFWKEYTSQGEHPGKPKSPLHQIPIWTSTRFEASWEIDANPEVVFWFHCWKKRNDQKRI